MALKNQTKAFFVKWLSLPTVRSFILVVGILVALLIGVFSIQAAKSSSIFAIIPDLNDSRAEIMVDTEKVQVSSPPLIVVYDKNFDLIIATGVADISPYEREHLNRLLNICELLMQNEETTIYWLDK